MMNGESGSGSPQDDNFDKMSIEERLSSKVWKARVSAYEELSKSFAKTSSESDPIFRQYTRNPDLLKAMVTDSNAVAQEKGIDAVKAFVEFGGKAAGKTREVVVSSLVEKCLGSARAGTKKNALDLIGLFAENEDVLGCEGLLNDLLDGLKAKQPKVVLGCVNALKDLLRDFGHKQVSPKPLLKRLPDIFAHSDKNVRAEGTQLAIELHRCIGAALEPTIANLKEIQARELRQQFEQVDKQKPIPIRFLLSQREKLEAAPVVTAAAGQEAIVEEEQPVEDEELDPYDLAEPVDVFNNKEYPADFEELIGSKKWQERKETLETVYKVLMSSLKIKPDSRFDYLVDHLSEKIKRDANINVVLISCQCLEAMAKGLRAPFAKYKERVIPPIIEKLKEKKASTVEVLAKTLDAIFQTVSFSDVLDYILAGTKHKNPSVKTESIRFLVRCLRTTKTPPAKADIKPIGDALVAAIADGSPDVRDAGAAGLGTLMKLIGERPMNPFLEGLDDIKKGKIQDEYAVAEVKVKMSTNGASKRPPAASTSARPKVAAAASRTAAASSFASDEPASRPPPAAPPPARGPPARTLARKPTVASSSASAAPKKPAASAAASKAGGSKGAASATEPVKYEFSSEDAEAKAANLIPEAVSTQLASGVWKERLAGMSEFNDWLKVEAETVESEIMVRALGKKPGWKESNFQVLLEVYRSLRMLAEESPTFGRPSVALSVQPLCDKLGDIKLKGPAGETLVVYAEKTSFGFVLSQALGPLAALKAPKAIADSLLWVDQSLLDFGTSGIDVRGLIDFLVNCLKSANAGVRTNATKAIGTLARFLGTALNNFVGDLNPQLKTAIEAEIEKASSNPPPAPTRLSHESMAANSAKKASSEENGGASSQVDQDLLDELVPRVDLDKLIPPSALARMGDSNWKERKEGLEEVQAIVTANTRLKSNMGDLSNALKPRYTDSNVVCKTLALDVIAKVATGMNKGFESHARVFVPSITQILADAKAPIRASAIAALTAIAEQVGAGPMLPGLSSVLESKTANPMLRQEVFQWLADWFDKHPPEKGMDLAPLALPAVQCLDDKLAAVRKAAQAALPFIIQRSGYKYVMEQASQLKAASQNSVIPMIDAAKAQASAKANAAKAQPSEPRSAVGAASRSATVSAASANPAISSSIASAGASSARTSSPVPASPRISTMGRLGGLKPPSAVGRSLKAPSSTLLSRQSRLPLDDSDSGTPRSRLSTVRKPTAAAASATTSASSPASLASDKSTPLITGDTKAKAAREKREGRGQNWIAADGSPRPELVEVLRQQCEGNLSRSLIDSMFSKVHSAEKEFHAALSLISDFVSKPTFAEEEYGLTSEETTERILANSDLIFKYIALRLTDNNTSLFLKCLDILEHLVELLSVQQYHMSDYEANCIFPCLVAKFGDPKVAFRDRIREIFRKMTFVFPPSKLLFYYVESGLPSKNARVRTECLGEVGYLFSKNGLQVCTPSKTLPLVAKQISDRDASVRTAALMTLGEAYKIMGEDIWKLVGSLPGKEMSLLEERLKRTSVGPVSKSSNGSKSLGISVPTSRASSSEGVASSPMLPSKTRSIPSRLARPGSIVGSGLPAPSTVKSRLPGPAAGRRESTIGSLPRVARRSLGGPHDSNSHLNGTHPSSSSTSSSPPPSPSSSNTTRASSQPKFGLRPPSVASRTSEVEESERGPEGEKEEDFAVELAINEILSSDPERSVKALKDIDLHVREMDPALIHHADQLAIVMSKQIHRVFSNDADRGPSNERLRKHLLAIGASVFEKDRTWEDGKTLGSYMSRPALISLLTVLLQQLIESTQSSDAQAQMVCKYLNVMILRCFASCQLNVLYAACFSMLAEATEDLRDLSTAVLQTRTKFAELIIKCLWKLGKRLPDLLADGEVDREQLLADVETFLQAIPPAEWRRRATDGTPIKDLPLRTIKSILNSYTQIFKDGSLEMLGLVQDPENSHVYQYLIRMISSEDSREGFDSFDSPNLGQSDRGSSRPQSTSASQDTAVHTASMASPKSVTSVSSEGRSSYPAAAFGEDNTQAELKDIFQKISNKQLSRQGIRNLYEFQKKYPHLEKSVENALQKTGPIFQRFIKRALANHANEDPSTSAIDSSERPESIDGFSTSNRDSASVRSSLAYESVTIKRSSSGSTTSTTASPKNSIIRNSQTEERLAELRAKFAKIAK